MTKVTTVIKLPNGSTKIRDGEAGVTITGRATGVDFNCDVEYGASPEQARAMTIIMLHWLRATYPDMLLQAFAGFLTEAGLMEKGSREVTIKLYDQDETGQKEN